MCGIAGIYKTGAKRWELESVLGTMNRVQKRRGPDDEGLFLNEEVGLAFGHTRLSILDLSQAGHQPMVRQGREILNSKLETLNKPKAQNSKSELVITFNGEIYNFLELRKELEHKGHQFKTKTDTEVILAAYMEWGAASFNRLRGMFAFGLWDGEKKKLFLVKDRYGIKPLYYYAKNGTLVFASTVKAIKASGLVPGEKNEKAAAIGFLLFGSVPLPYTTFKNVYGIPAGNYLEANLTSSQDVNIKLVKYYEPLEYFNVVSSQDQRSFEDQNIGLHVRELLEDSISKHLISDAPLGVFLSGGIDSSALAILASSAEALRVGGAHRLKTLSIIFDEPEYSEKKYQDLIAKQIKSDHREYKITKKDFFAGGESASGGENALPDIWEAMDQPTVDGINTYFVAEAAKKAGLKTVLSGLGADEVFFGYSHFKRAAMIKKVQRIASMSWIRKPLGLTKPITLGLLRDRYAKLDYLCSPDILRFYLAIRGLFSPAEVAKILNINVKEVNDFLDLLVTSYQLLVTDLDKLHPANLLSYLELKFYLQNQLLKDSDFMAMHHGIEIRVPFLDHPLVEYISSLSVDAKFKFQISNFKFQNIPTKSLLIASMGNDLPRQVWDRDKMGFTFPFQHWLSQTSNVNGQLCAALRSEHWSRIWAKEVLKKF